MDAHRVCLRARRVRKVCDVAHAICLQYRQVKLGTVFSDCSCDPNVIETIKYNSFKVGCRCKKCHQQRTTKTVLERYGVDHLSKNEESKAAMLSGVKAYVEAKKNKIEMSSLRVVTRVR